MVDLATGEVVAQRNSTNCLTPASVTKIITTATALELLGPDFTFTTYIEIDGTLSSDGTLNGNLLIRGGADPTLGSVFLGDRNFISHFANEIQRYGIRHITGDIIANASCLDHCPVPLKWSWEDIGMHYGAGAYGLSAYDNTSIITLNSGNTGTVPQILNIWPELPNMRTINEINIPTPAKDEVVVLSAPYGMQRILIGSISPNRNNQIVKASISNPPLLVATSLCKALNDRGIVVDGKAVVNDSIQFTNTDTIYTNHSKPLSDIIRLTNFKSNNLYAEHTFRRLGCNSGINRASSEMSIKAVKSFWKSKGINTDNLIIYDGCGLAPQNAFSANFLTKILVYMSRSDNWEKFYNSLPTAGEEGTVGAFLYGTPLKGKARIKSGSISGVQCYSGYITPDSGKRYAFTIMVNNFTCKRSEIKQLITQWLVNDAK